MELAVCAPNKGGLVEHDGQFYSKEEGYLQKKGVAFFLFNLSFTHFISAGHGMQIL